MPKKRKLLHSRVELIHQSDVILNEKPNDYEFYYKNSLVNQVLKGKTAVEVSKNTYYSPRSIQLFVQTVDEKGFEALKTQSKLGRPSKLTSYQIDEIKCVLDDPNSAYELEYLLWDGVSLSDYIEKSYGVKVSSRYCQELFHKLHYSYKIPQTFPNYQKNQEAREKFKARLTELLQDKNNIIVSQDEVHFQQGTTVTRMWCPQGFIPVVSSAPGKRSIAYSGFVILGKGNGQLFIDKPDWFTYETTIQSIRKFLDAYPINPPFKLYMILDNAPWHKKAKRLIMDKDLEEYQDIRKRVEFLDIPPYSPDLNPIEQVWRYTRKHTTHNVYFPNLELLEETLDSFWEPFKHANSVLSSLCTFKFKDKSSQRQKYQVGNHIYDNWIHSLNECRELAIRQKCEVTVYSKNMFL